VVEQDYGRAADRGKTVEARRGRSLGASHAGRRFLARGLWSLVSFGIVFITGVTTGLHVLDNSTVAPWVRSGILLSAVILLVVVARAVGTSMTKGVEQQELLTECLVRRKVDGPFRRWAIWISSAFISCAVSYLLNEHRPAKTSLLPARSIDVPVIVVSTMIVAPYIFDLYRGSPPRKWPWSRSAYTDRKLRESDDVIGAISRMSPPLLFAMFLALFMFIAIYVVSIHEPAKLLGGFGVFGLFCAGLLAAPSLLQVQAKEIEPVWRARWYEKQRNAAVCLRAAIAKAHRVVVVTQVALMGAALGFVTSGSRPTLAASRMTLIALVLGPVGWALARALWTWAPTKVTRSLPAQTS
jgi:hypothetical protein